MASLSSEAKLEPIPLPRPHFRRAPLILAALIVLLVAQSYFLPAGYEFHVRARHAFLESNRGGLYVGIYSLGGAWPNHFYRSPLLRDADDVATWRLPITRSNSVPPDWTFGVTWWLLVMPLLALAVKRKRSVGGFDVIR